MSNPPDPFALPQFDLHITSHPVSAAPRKMKAQWTATGVEDLRSLWGGGRRWPRPPDNALDILKDALDDPDYDPATEEPYKGLWRHEDGRIATPEEITAAQSPERSLVEAIADEMTAEIDREVMRGSKRACDL